MVIRAINAILVGPFRIREKNGLAIASWTSPLLLTYFLLGVAIILFLMTIGVIPVIDVRFDSTPLRHVGLYFLLLMALTLAGISIRGNSIKLSQAQLTRRTFAIGRNSEKSFTAAQIKGFAVNLPRGEKFGYLPAVYMNLEDGKSYPLALDLPNAQAASKLIALLHRYYSD